MNNSRLLSRAVATAAATLGACLPACLSFRREGARLGVLAGALACALDAALASPAAAFSPTSKAGGENTPLNLGASGGSTHAAASSSGGASIVRTIVGLAIVIAVIWGLAWILKQVKAGKDPHLSSEGLASVAALTLGSGRSVHLVRAGSDYVLLGSTEHGVAPIHRYSEEEAREVGLLAPAAPPKRPRLLSGAAQLIAGTRPRPEASAPWLEDQVAHSPVVGPRPDPMRAPAPSANVIDRLREMTVRR
ncbi:MAG TPA: flagellar biosynthetic protein FliO [Solirubrobacteraceae bacterium]|nr:flagellar biosynthetic protein FliO [Solirubrobacteraceae bacterium]